MRFQRSFSNWEYASSNPARSARHSMRSARRPKEMRNKAGNAGFSRIRFCLQTSQFADFGAPIAESLRPPTRIFPFCGEQRPETGFERHCVGRLAVASTAFSSHLFVKSGMADRRLRYDACSRFGALNSQPPVNSGVPAGEGDERVRARHARCGARSRYFAISELICQSTLPAS